MIGTKYKDTAEGAKQFIIKESTLKLTEKTKCIPDPSVEGVWKVTELLDKGKDYAVTVDAIVYMAGYKDPFGREREYNDFEMGDAR